MDLCRTGNSLVQSRPSIPTVGSVVMQFMTDSRQPLILKSRVISTESSQKGVVNLAIQQYRDKYVCVCVCVCLFVRRITHSKITRPNFTIFFAHVACGHGSVLLWSRCLSNMVLPVSWMTSSFHIMASLARHVFPAAVEHDTHNSRISNRIMLSDNDQKVIIIIIIIRRNVTKLLQGHACSRRKC